MTVLQMIIIGMIVIIIATVTLAVLSYGAFKIRDRKSPRHETPDAGEPMFFERVRIAAPIRRHDG
jgi:heme/copper-type cytochrome/quinol oxidase subunit 2